MHERKLIELQGKTDEPTVIVRDFNTLPSVIDSTSRQKISEFTVEQNSTINQLDLIDIYKTLQQQENAHLSQAHKEHSTK